VGWGEGHAAQGNAFYLLIALSFLRVLPKGDLLLATPSPIGHRCLRLRRTNLLSRLPFQPRCVIFLTVDQPDKDMRKHCFTFMSMGIL